MFSLLSLTSCLFRLVFFFCFQCCYLPNLPGKICWEELYPILFSQGFPPAEGGYQYMSTVRCHVFIIPITYTWLVNIRFLNLEFVFKFVRILQFITMSLFRFLWKQKRIYCKVYASFSERVNGCVLLSDSGSLCVCVCALTCLHQSSQRSSTLLTDALTSFVCRTGQSRLPNQNM